MKYIDADKLIAEIERLNSLVSYESKDRHDEGLHDAYKAVKNVITSLQQEQPKEICSKCIYHGKDDDYCYYPHGGMRSLINENGVYECTGFYEKEQEQPEVDLEKETDQWRHKHFKGKRDGDYSGEYLERESQLDLARHFYELGRKARKLEI